MNTLSTLSRTLGLATLALVGAAAQAQSLDAGAARDLYRSQVLGDTSISAVRPAVVSPTALPGSHARYLISVDGLPAAQAIAIARQHGEQPQAVQSQTATTTPRSTQGSGEQAYQRYLNG